MDPQPTVLPLGTARRWTRVAGAFFAVHLTQQVAAMATGLLFIRTLSVDDFAIYTMATSVLLTFSFATDLGSSSALLHFFHQSKQGKEPYANMVSAVLSLRRWMFLAGTPIAIGVLLWWGRSEGLTPATIGLISVLVVATVWVQVQGTTRIVILRLEGAYARSYRAEVTAALARLGVAAVLIVVGLRDPVSALATALVSACVLTWVAHEGRLPAAETPVAALQRKVVRYLAPSLPSAVYYAIQGQFVIWCAAWFGDLALIANIGALGRLGLIVGAFGGLSSVVFLPRLVQIVDEGLFVRRMFQFGAILAAMGGTLFVASVAAPSAFLWLLGASYESLSRELPLVVAAAGLGLLGGYFGAVASARSWNRLQPGALLLMMGAQAVMIVWPFSSETTSSAPASMAASITLSALPALAA